MQDAHKVAEIKWVKAPSNASLVSRQIFYGKVTGAKKGKFSAVDATIRTAVNAGKAPWVKVHAGWINGSEGKAWLASNPNSWSTSDVAPADENVVAPHVTDPNVGDKNGVTAPPNSMPEHPAIPNTPSEGEMQKFSETKVKETYFDFNGRTFDPAQFKEQMKLRAKFTGPKGLGGGVTEEMLLSAPEGSLDFLILNHPSHTKALIYELLHSRREIREALVTKSKENAELIAKAA